MAQSDDTLDQWLEAQFGAAGTAASSVQADDPDVEAAEAAAAAYDLACMDDRADAMPAGLAERIRVAAELTDAAAGPADARVVSLPTARQRTQRRRGAAMAWLAVAATLVIAVAGWWPRLAPLTAPDTTIDLAAERDALIANAEQLIRVPLSGTDDPAGTNAAGELVFDPATQRGFITVRNLAANQPTVSQYQLWIFDAARKPHPVDGGVFDVDDPQQAVIDFQAKLPVADPHLFAITVEQPGGVVVSDQERIAVVGKVEA